MVSIELVAQPSRVDTVALRIRELVESGNLSAGDRLPSEPELVGKLKVSRTVLREAISRLETIGLLSVVRGRGTFVGDRASLSLSAKLLRSALAISPRDLLKVAEFRRAMECYCARQAAKLATPAQVSQLQDLYEQMMACKSDMTEAMRLDFRFHLAIVAISGNELMRNVMEVLQEFILAGMVQTLNKNGAPSPRRDQHLAILEAIRAGDPAAAEQAMTEHMDLLDNRLHLAESQGVAH